jgi:hypothetical protein
MDQLRWLEDALKRRILKNLEGKEPTEENMTKAAMEAYTAYAAENINVEIEGSTVHVSVNDVRRIWEGRRAARSK